jgi:hypothetical protein
MAKGQRAFDTLEAEETSEDLMYGRRPHRNAGVGQIKMMLQASEVRDDGPVSELLEGKQINDIAFEERSEDRLDNGNSKDHSDQIEEAIRKPSNTNIVGNAATNCSQQIAGGRGEQ